VGAATALAADCHRQLTTDSNMRALLGINYEIGDLSAFVHPRITTPSCSLRRGGRNPGLVHQARAVAAAPVARYKKD
jgi:hypothetical protein